MACKSGAAVREDGGAGVYAGAGGEGKHRGRQKSPKAGWLWRMGVRAAQGLAEGQWRRPQGKPSSVEDGYGRPKAATAAVPPALRARPGSCCGSVAALGGGIFLPEEERDAPDAG